MNVFVRTDASVRIGTGHLMRCLALAEVLRHAGSKVTFVMREVPPSLAAMLEVQGFGLRLLPVAGLNSATAPDDRRWLGVPWETDALQTAAILEYEEAPDWLVVDHYGIDYRWEERVRTANCKMLIVDDLAEQKHACEILLNQNLIAHAEERYRTLVPQACRLLAGPRFALLRQEFRTSRTSLRPRPEHVRSLLVFLGGADPDGVTLRVLKAVDAMRPSDIQVTVVLGGANPHHEIVNRIYGRQDGCRIILQAANMAQLMVEADLAIGAGGISTWERCCLGLPAVVIAIAENQLAVSRAAAEAGACLYLGAAADLSDGDMAAAVRLMISNSNLRKSMSKAGLRLVDGLGCQRVAKAMSQEPLRVRSACADDAERVFAWRNAEETRRYSHDPKPLSLEKHLKWFQRTLVDSKRLLLIGEGPNGPVGVLRCDFADRVATVSIYLDPSVQGRGYGGRLLSAGEQWLKMVRPDIERLRAEVLLDNPRSRHVFSEAGFSETSVLCEKVVNAASTEAASESG